MRAYDEEDVEEEGVAVFEAAGDGPVDAFAGAAAGVEGVVLGAAEDGEVSFFSPVPAPAGSLPVLDGGFSLSE